MKFARVPALVGAVMLAALGLSSCNSLTEAQKGPCPYVKIPTLLAQMTQFGGGQARDATNVVFQSRIVDVASACEYSDAKYATVKSTPTGRETMEVQLKIKFSTQRGPLAQGQTVSAKYLVAVTDLRDNIINRGEFPVQLKLGAGGQVLSTEEEAWMLFKVTDKSGSAFRIYTGFVLDQDQLDFNKSLIGGG
ncbi:MAG: hypothetical protein ACYC1L_14380 [Alphaproteobacteria bacterium]